MTKRQAAAASIVLAVLLFGVLTVSGSPLITSLLLSILVVFQAVSGAALWRVVRPQAPPLEHAGAALAVGTAFAALAGIATATLGWGSWGWAVPSVVALAFIGRSRFLTAPSSRSSWDKPTVLGLTAALVPGLAIVAYALRLYPLAWTGTWGRYHPDMPFFEAISIHIANFGPFSTPFLTEGAVRYHWLSYAWAGQLTLAADAAPFITITRVLPVVALAGSAAMVASWTRQLSKRSWTPTLAGLLLSLGGFTGAVFGGVLTMDSPSQSMSVLWLIAFSIAVVHLVQNRNSLWLSIPFVGLMSFALVGAKVSAAAPAVAGVLLMTAVEALRRRTKSLQAIWLAVATAVGTGLGFAFFLAGSLGGGGLTIGSLVDKASSQQGLNPTDTRYAVVAGTAILVLAVLPRWAGVFWLASQREWRWRPEVTYSLGLAISSIGALIAFNSFNEVWFSSTVSGPLAAISAVGAGDALSRISRHSDRSPWTLILVTTAIAALIFAGIWQLWSTGASGGNVWVPTLRWLGPILAWIVAILAGLVIAWFCLKHLSFHGTIAAAVAVLVFVSVPGRLLGLGTGLVATQENGLRNEWFSVGQIKYALGRDKQAPEEWSDAQLRAAAWLRANAESSDLLGTNLTLGTLVPAITHLPTYVSGIGYQSPYGYPSMSPVLLAHEEQVWDFIENPSMQAVQPLCDANVRWLWIDLSRTDRRDWQPFYSTQVTEPDTVIAELDSSQCN